MVKPFKAYMHWLWVDYIHSFHPPGSKGINCGKVALKLKIKMTPCLIIPVNKLEEALLNK